MEVLIVLILVAPLVLLVAILARTWTLEREIRNLRGEVQEGLDGLRVRERGAALKEAKAGPGAGGGEMSASPSEPAREEEEEQEQDHDHDREEGRGQEPEAGRPGAKESLVAARKPPPLPASSPAPSKPAESPPREAPAVAAREPGTFETAAREAWRRIWNWLVVGEEHRPAGVTMEFAVATTWLLRVGVLILVVGIGFFLNYTTANEQVPPMLRVAVAALTGLGLLVGGVRMFRGRYDLLGQGLAGAGFATLYFSFFTARELGVLDAPAAFGVMILVTVAAGLVAVRYDSLLIAVLGLLGGYLTPMMIGDESAGVIPLFGYVLMLGLGVFFMAWKKDWRLLHYLSFAATVALFAMAVDRGFEPLRFWQFMPFLLAYFVLFSTVTFIHHLVHREKATLLELLFLFLNAGVFLGFAAHLMDRTFPREALAIVTLGMAVFYVGHTWAFLKRRVRDRGLMFSFLGLASFFVAITLPLVLSEGWITVAWAIQGFVMLWIAARMRSEFLRQLAYVLYLIVLARFALFDLGGQFDEVSRSAPAGAYLLDLAERIAVFGIPIGSFFAAGRLFSRAEAAESSGAGEGEPGDDLRPWFGRSRLARIGFWIALALGFVYLNLELFHSVAFFYEPLVGPSLTLLWIGLAAVLLREILAGREGVALPVFAILAVALVGKVFLVDVFTWNPGLDLAFDENRVAPDMLVRLLNYGAVVAFLAGAWRILRGREGRGAMAGVFGYASLGGLFVYTSLEAWTVLDRFLPDFRMGGLSIFWGLFALALLLTGMTRNRALLRGLGLALLGGVVLKVFFVDLAGLDQLYRIVAFLVLGLVVLVGSFLYLKYSSRFLTGEREETIESETGS